ncbi:MAG TPA: ATP-binding cassette domain-containing protein [Methanoregula sp.]|nr:ATP-binding cassette domain-containing protein [Methanoregula sp.]
MSSIILEAREIRYRYPRGMEAICGISFHIRKKEKIALVGPNGAGKSTLLAMFNGMIRPNSGVLLFDNQPVQYDSASLRMLRKRVGFVLQNPDRQIIAPTVYQDVAFGPTNLGYPEREVKRVVTRALRHVGLEGFEHRPPHQLSGGEKKRVAIAGVLAMDPDVLVLDEPTSGLDPSGSEDIMELLDELNHEGKTIIISTHNVELAYPWVDRAILMLEGKILEEGIPEKAFGNPEYVRRAHLSLPTLLELHIELQKRGFHLQGKKPHTVLDMMQAIETLFEKTYSSASPGAITIYNVDRHSPESFTSWHSGHSGVSIGAMGTRAKQRAENEHIHLDFTYGVIDKCILRALLGENSLIMTTDTMVDRVFQRVNAYVKESSIPIIVNMMEGGSS